MYGTGKKMDNLLSYCGLVDARIRASNKDLPVQKKINKDFILLNVFWKTKYLLSANLVNLVVKSN